MGNHCEQQFHRQTNKAKPLSSSNLLHEHDEGYEEAIKAGLRDRYLNGLPWRELEKKYRVRMSTLRRRFKGGKDRFHGHEVQAHLTKEEEVLVKYCKYQALLTQPLNSLALRHHIYVMSGRKPTDKWSCQFLRRHPEIEMKSARGLDPKRAHAFSRESVTHFFELVKTEVVNKGAACPPGFILPYTHGKVAEWSHVEGVGSVVTSENGWTDNAICSDWFKKVFLPWVKTQRDSAFPIIFISDGHTSHETHEICLATLDNSITMISLSPHTTHKLQPLDVGVFVPLQRNWGKRYNELVVTGDEITCDTVIEEYMATWTYGKQLYVFGTWAFQERRRATLKLVWTPTTGDNVLYLWGSIFFAQAPPERTDAVVALLADIWNILPKYSGGTSIDHQACSIGLYLSGMVTDKFHLPYSLPSHLYYMIFSWFQNSLSTEQDLDDSTESPSIEVSEIIQHLDIDSIARGIAKNMRREIYALHMITHIEQSESEPASSPSPRLAFFQIGDIEFNKAICLVIDQLLKWQRKRGGSPPPMPDPTEIKHFLAGGLQGPTSTDFCLDWGVSPHKG
ncbi:hypothetical protein M422DRAFT_266009 [Sphaerobolus stellatus SS14]|uniref:DDE-1 domain-containing protein n=1 Tax=Sphaerobolus stellatus (strain SS14) TaxID=990650 RepID=A0A0C9V447_SPHS4|nr:hypothetical protein M422DRAFT_266009 [Sphaerobolus stellatus SS14]